MVRCTTLALLLVGCSEYGLKEPLDGDLPATDGGGDGGGGDGTTPGGGATTPSEPPTDEQLDDLCFAAEFGFETSPAARLVTTDPDTAISVTLTLSDTAYDDHLLIDAPIVAALIESWSAPAGEAVEVGPFAVGTELVFAIDVLNTGDHWQSGPADRNADLVAHVAVTYEGDCSWLMGFEDLYGGGDLDYNDVVFRIEGLLVEQ